MSAACALCLHPVLHALSAASAACLTAASGASMSAASAACICAVIAACGDSDSDYHSLTMLITFEGKINYYL